VIGFIPFVTTLLSDNDGSVATSLYAATMVAVALILIRMWYYAAGKGFVESKVPPAERWRDVTAWIQIAAIFGISIVVAQFNATAAKLMWLLLLVPFDKLVAGRAPR
jgi:phosphatidylglycerophosphate synthase